MSKLPQLAWLYCYGTIASQNANRLEIIDYGPSSPNGLPSLMPEDIIKAIPELSKVVDVKVVLVHRNDNKSDSLLKYAKSIMKLDPDMPVMLTHGTNILPEVGFFLDVVLNRPGPVVLSGSMRPFSALSSDAKYNLLQAASLALHPSSRSRGVIICLSDRITSAYYAMKTSANRMDTFKCFEAGHLGLMNNLTPHYFYEPTKPTGKPHLNVSKIEKLPRVALIWRYIDQPEEELDAKLDDPTLDGLVIAGFGNASAGDWEDKLAERASKGQVIVRTSIQPDSHTTPIVRLRDQIAAGDLGPSKALLLLKLALAVYGKDIKAIKKIFGTDFVYNAVPE